MQAMYNLLCKYPKGLTDGEMVSKLRKGESLKKITSKTTISNIRKALMVKEFIIRDPKTRRYIKTPEWDKNVEMLNLVDKLASCNYMQTDQYVFIDKVSGKEITNIDNNPNATYVLIESKRTDDELLKLSNINKLSNAWLKKYGQLDWWTDIIEKVAKEKGLDYSGQRKKTQQELFKGVSKIFLVQVLDPVILLERAKCEKSVSKLKKNSVDKCPECGNKITVKDGEKVCSVCGLVIGNVTSETYNVSQLSEETKSKMYLEKRAKTNDWDKPLVYGGKKKQ